MPITTHPDPVRNPMGAKKPVTEETFAEIERLEDERTAAIKRYTEVGVAYLEAYRQYHPPGCT